MTCIVRFDLKLFIYLDGAKKQQQINKSDKIIPPKKQPYKRIYLKLKLHFIENFLHKIDNKKNTY